MYVSDIRLPNMLHAALLRSMHAHARIRAVDVKEALRLDGVVGVWTGREIEGRISPFPESFEIHPARWLEGVKPVLQGPRPTALAQEKVHYVGEPVAIIVAEDRPKAEDAIDAIVVEYEGLPVVVDPEESLQPRATLVHEGSNNNVVFSFRIEKGNVDGALGAAPYTLRERFRHHRYCAAPLEGRGVVAWVEPKTNILTVWSSTQMPHLVRRQIAAQLSLPEETVRVIAPDIGGGFGPKVFVYPEEILVPFLALQLGCPVKWIEDRTEHFISTAHGRDQLHDVECAFDEEGHILAFRDRFLLDNGAYNPMGLTDAIRLVVRGAGVPMTPVDVRDRLQAIGFDVSKYANDLAAVHTILKRLNESGELRFIPRAPGKHQYIWNRPTTPVVLTRDIVRKMYENTAEHVAMHATHVDDEPRPPRRRRGKSQKRARQA